MREKQPTYAILTPKNDFAKKKMTYHSEKWILLEEINEVRYTRDSGPFLVLRSRDGKKCIIAKKTDDADFDVRVL
jgi:hypothetical protein